MGISFGNFLEVDGGFFRGEGLQTNFSAITEDVFANSLDSRRAALRALARLKPRNVDILQYGGKLRMNLLRGALVPFITGGAGIIRFAPNDLESSNVLYASVGAGMTIYMGRLSFSMAPEVLSYRYNPAATLLAYRELKSAGLTSEDFRGVRVDNLALSGSLQYSLGELTYRRRQYYGDGLELAAELFYGQINFSGDLDFPASRGVIGISAGFDAGPYIGLRGFYWRDSGQETGFAELIPSELGSMTAYGGELNLRFRRGTTPYLIAGGGYMDIDKDDYNFTGATGKTPASRYFASGGGGIEVPLSSSITLSGSIRGLFMSTGGETASRLEDVSTSVMYSASILFRMGGGSRRRSHEKPVDQVDTKAIETALSRIQSRLDAMEQSDSSSVRAVDDDILSIRVPETGEVYIRYGDPVMPDAQTLIAPPLILDADTLSEQPPVAEPATTTDGVTVEEIRQIIRQELQGLETEAPDIGRFIQRLQEIETRLLALESRVTNEQVAEEEEEAQDPTAAADTMAAQDSTETQPQRQRMGIVKAIRQIYRADRMPLLGFQMGDEANQLLLGVRSDYRIPDYGVRLLPEATLGLSNGISINVMGNIAFPILTRWAAPVQPYTGAGIGIGIHSRPDMVFNLLAGVEYPFFWNITAFSEFSTQNLFSTSRLYFGVRLRP